MDIDEKDFGTLYAENGFEIVKSGVFIREADNVDLNELLDRLVNLRKKMNSSADIMDFSKNVISKLSELENIINRDDYYGLSDTSKLNKLSEDLQSIRRKFTSVQSYIKAEENMRLQKQNMADIFANVKRKSYELDQNSNLTAMERNKEAQRLLNERNAASNGYNEALKFYNEQKKLYDEYKDNFNLINYKNELLQNINALEDDLKDLALAPENKEKLQTVVADIRNDIAYFGLESIKSKQEFDSLCQRYGLASTAKVEKINVKKENNNEPKEIKNNENKLENIFNKLKELNPDVELALNENVINPSFDGRIEASVPVADLKLPEDYYVVDNGISNKFSGNGEPVMVEIGELQKENESVLDQSDNLNTELANTQQDPSLYAKAKSAISRLTQKGRVEPNKKYAVKKSRTAIIGSYAKSLLTFSGITACAALAGAPVISMAALGAGLGVAVQTLYRKIVKDTDVTIKAFEGTQYQSAPENAPALVGLWHKAGESLMNVFKRRKTGEIKSNKVDSEINVDREEQLEDLSNEIDNALNAHQEYQEEILESLAR